VRQRTKKRFRVIWAIILRCRHQMIKGDEIEETRGTQRIKSYVPNYGWENWKADIVCVTLSLMAR